MKILLHTLFFFLLATQICFGQWYAQNSGTTQHFNKVQFVDANIGWAVGDSGTIVHTTNAGAAWVQQASGTNLNLVDISFVDANKGWVVGENFILKTTDGGISWSQQIHDSLSFNAVLFIDENIGWLCGDGIILKTTDGGNIWIPKTLPPDAGPIYDVQFLDPYTGFAVGHYKTILKTMDGGDNWILQMCCDYTGRFNRISFSDSENGFVVGDAGFWHPLPMLYRTTNGGADWLFVTDNGIYHNDVYSINSNIVYVVGSLALTVSVKAQILRSSDAGTTWDEQLFEEYKAFSGVHFLDVNIGWVVGDSGTVLHTTNGGVTFMDNEITQPREFILEQNYPNPFNPITVISYQLPVSSEITLKVFDVLGNEIATLVDEYKPAGRYEVEFSASVLPSGVYFYQFRAGKFAQTKKMILIR